jgi:hypothetical protein
MLQPIVTLNTWFIGILDIETDKILTDFHHDFNNNVVEAVYKT